MHHVTWKEKALNQKCFFPLNFNPKVSILLNQHSLKAPPSCQTVADANILFQNEPCDHATKASKALSC